MTPYECREWCEAAAKREGEAYKRDLWAAWHVAIFQRQKKLPDIGKLMKRIDRPVPEKKSPDALRAKVRLLAAAFGGRLTRG